MTLRYPRLPALIATVFVTLSFASDPAGGQMIVYDPSNYAQNVLQAARALQQINNQITSLQNQTQMLLNQARNLASLPYSSLQTIEQSIARTQQLINQAQRLAYDINQIDQAFQRTYPQSYAGSITSQQLIGDAQTRWRNSLAAYQDALRVQAGVVQGFDTTRTETSGLVSASQSAAGILQASQSGNQLIALQTRQLVDLTALIAAQSRAQSLEGARLIANQEQARVQLNQFLTSGRGYQAQTVQMFHQ
jgi:P-type conjugative transfer protein TrbJ